MLSEITIDDKTITLLHTRKLINHNVTQQFAQGSITISEYNIDHITTLTNDPGPNPNIYLRYFPKRVFSDLVHFLVEIIKNDVEIKSVYCFGLHQHDPYENPHDIQAMFKDIEVILNLETPETIIKQLILDCINNMEDSDISIEEELNGVTLTVVKVELLKEFKEQRIINIQSYKEDKCVICLDTKPNILFCNCGHLVVCEECYKVMEVSKCPKC